RLDHRRAGRPVQGRAGDRALVADQRRAEILTSLTAIEAEKGVRILFACESGSRGWGFASPDSDFDVRFLYVHPLPWYLRVRPQRDVIEQPITGDLDINGWELRKALGLLGKGNATLIEWLDSPIVYRADAVFLQRLRALAESVYQPERAFHHYVHMARGNYRDFLTREQVRLKKYLYVLRPLLATLWIEQDRGPVPMRFETLVQTLIDAPKLRAAIDQLLVIKRSVGEAEVGAPLPLLNAFINRELTRLASVAPPLARPVDEAALDQLLLDTLLGVG
ncbi:nucleotidyltransferase domain-containing protein, partial [Lamprobacter modestohalophilus]|uniref:nucleotidyltransferase domain-containing protein n=1 Tax=Lamprobacter modestohalophilus TaxID=1064514 RepID=UPI0030841D82